MTDLERSHAELRRALILAGRRIRKLNFGRRDDPVLVVLRRVLREARGVGSPGDPHVARLLRMGASPVGGLKSHAAVPGRR